VFDRCSAVDSPYLVAWYGAALVEGRLTMVMELCSRGSLYDVMKHPACVFNWKRLFTWFTQMIKGLRVSTQRTQSASTRDWINTRKALHKSNIVHRDFKSLNVMVKSERCAVVCAVVCGVH
jgi:serine/threonine protein kinase